MTDHAATIERLRHAAQRIEVKPDLDLVTRGAAVPSTPHTRSTHRQHRVLLVGACLALVVAGGIGVVLSRRNSPSAPASVVGESPWSQPTPVPGQAPTPGSLAPAVASPPHWLDDLAPAMRDGNLRSGHWVSMAIAQRGIDGFEDAVVVSVFDGSFAALREAERVEVNGQEYDTVQVGAWQAFATLTTPTLLVEGAVPLTQLTDVMSAARIISNGTDISVALDGVPDRYEVIVAPQVLGEDTSPRRTLVSRANSLAINEVSDWIDPLLYAAGTGTDIERVDLGDDITAWTGTTNERIPLTFLVWSREPGVVLEITTTDDDRPVADLIAVANETTTLPVAEWEAAYAD